MNINVMTDEQLAKEIRAKRIHDYTMPDFIKFLRQCVADSIPSEEEIKKVILRWDSVVADDGLAEDMAAAIRKLMEGK